MRQQAISSHDADNADAAALKGQTAGAPFAAAIKKCAVTVCVLHVGGLWMRAATARQDLGVQSGGEARRSVERPCVQFANDLADSVAFGDARYLDIRRLLRDTLGDDVPEMPDPRPFEAKAAGEIDLDGFGAVVFTSGFRPDYGGWVNFPVFDERGFPIVDDALATAVPGLYFCGVHFLRKRRSSLLFGVGEDAAIVARTITKALTASPTSA